MAYDVDHEYEFRTDESGVPFLPDDLKSDDNLFILPNGKYLPPGLYHLPDGSELLYEPQQLSPYADMPSQDRGELAERARKTKTKPESRTPKKAPDLWVPAVDPSTGKPVINPKTGKQMMERVFVD